MIDQIRREIQLPNSKYYLTGRSVPTESRSIYTPRKEDFVGSFRAVLERWIGETQFLSNPDLATAHPSFDALVENAGLVLTQIKGELMRGPSNLVWVLEDFFNQAPYSTDEIGNISVMSMRWVAFLEERGH